MMLIKQNLLERTLDKGFVPVYLVFGNDEFLVAEACHQIKRRYLAAHECDFQSLQVTNEADCNLLIEHANSYSLFHSHSLIEALYTKKSIDKAFDNSLKRYLASPNPQSLILIKAPFLSLKAVQSLAIRPELHAVQIVEMNAEQQKKWIESLLQNKQIPNYKDKAALIFQYTEGNLFASHQAIIKLEMLPQDALANLNNDELAAQLIDEREFENHQLVVYLLSGQHDKVKRSIERAVRSRGENLLILWYLTQTIRQLIGLLAYQSGQSSVPPEKLGIWQSRLGLYQSALKRLNLSTLQSLLLICHDIDIQIKTQYRNEEERLTEVALKLCSQKS